jgi:NACalpha-BTF3-like transcription factor
MGCLFSRRQSEGSISEYKPLMQDASVAEPKSRLSIRVDTTQQQPSSSTLASPTDIQSPTSPPHINNLENSLFLYKNTKHIDRDLSDTYKDLFTEVDTPIQVITEEIIEQLVLRARVSADKAREAIIDNNMIVRDAFSQILTEKIQLIMDETNENIHRARKVLCEQNNDEQRAIQYLRDVQSLIQLGNSITRARALQVYYENGKNVEQAKRVLVLELFLNRFDNRIDQDEAIHILEQNDYNLERSLRHNNTSDKKLIKKPLLLETSLVL